VLPFPFVLLGKNFFQPVRLPLSDFLVHEGGVLKHDELLAATFTAKSAHLPESWRLLSGLPLLDRHCLHRLTFYPAAYLTADGLENRHHWITHEKTLLNWQHVRYYAVVHFCYESWMPSH